MQPDISQLRQEDWQEEFDLGALERGRNYAAQGRSTLLRLSPELLEASCRGSATQSYRQRIRLLRHAGGWQVAGTCSCPVGYNCKHVVAALVALENQPAPPPEQESPLPERLLDDVRPIPLLILGSHVRMHYDARKGRMVEQLQHRAALAFLYGEQRTSGKAAKDLLVRRADEVLRIRRDAEAETGFRQTLAGLGFQVALRQSEALPESTGELFELPDDAAWLHLVRQELPKLRERGWRIEMRPDFHFNLLDIDDWYLQLEQRPEQDWFDLEMGIEVEGQRISLLPILLYAIRNTPWLLTPEALAKRRDDEMLLVPVPRAGGARRIALPFGRLKPLLNHLGELFLREPGDDSEHLRLARPDAARLAALEESLPLHWQGGEALRSFAQRLRDLPQREVLPPAGLRAELRAYQRQGLTWMQTLRELGVGGVLADDMGLGKTLQTLAHILLEKQAGRLTAPALVVMPTSLIPNWQDEAARFAPQLRVLALHGPKRGALFEEIAGADVLLTSYALLSRDLKALARQPYHLLILDEAQHIKNPRSKAAQAAGELSARHRLCLTGTPLENHLGELWSLFNLLMPGWLGSEQRFKRDYRTPIEKHGDAVRLAHLKARVKPFLLRRTKEQVATELPPKTEITQLLELTQAQRDRYETLRLAMDSKVRTEIQRQGLARSQLVILEALLRLRQVCCDLRLLDGEAAATYRPADSGKLTALMEMLEELFAEGRRVLLFSQFTGMLELIERELEARRIPYALLTGSTRDRRTPVEEFQSGKLPIFLISLKAGGAGLNLTAADTVIHFDPWWNPAAEAQASDRAYRIGQDKPVFVYRLIARGSVEEKIQQLQKAKASLARDVLEGAAQGESRMSEEDLAALFAPLD